MVIFLKLGGSLITDKNIPYHAEKEVIAQVGEEILSALKESPNIQLVLGHGSGSFGHTAAAEFNTREGVHSKKDWTGFLKVWQAARALNVVVCDTLAGIGLPVISFPPSAFILGKRPKITSWNTAPIKSALSHNLIPVIHGDVVFDEGIGGTIFSTEELFIHLTQEIHPGRILIAGKDKGVYKDYPHNQAIYPLINSANYTKVNDTIGTSGSLDVTGGMAAKVTEMMKIAANIEGLEVFIFSGLTPGNVKKAFHGECPGTRIAGI